MKLDFHLKSNGNRHYVGFKLANGITWLSYALNSDFCSCGTLLTMMSSRIIRTLLRRPLRSAWPTPAGCGTTALLRFRILLTWLRARSGSTSSIRFLYDSGALPPKPSLSVLNGEECLYSTKGISLCEGIAPSGDNHLSSLKYSLLLLPKRITFVV